MNENVNQLNTSYILRAQNNCICQCPINPISCVAGSQRKLSETKIKFLKKYNYFTSEKKPDMLSPNKYHSIYYCCFLWTGHKKKKDMKFSWIDARRPPGAHPNNVGRGAVLSAPKFKSLLVTLLEAFQKSFLASTTRAGVIDPLFSNPLPIPRVTATTLHKREFRLFISLNNYSSCWHNWWKIQFQISSLFQFYFSQHFMQYSILLSLFNII